MKVFEKTLFTFAFHLKLVDSASPWAQLFVAIAIDILNTAVRLFALLLLIRTVMTAWHLGSWIE